MRKIFKYFTLQTPATITYMSWFINQFPETEFSGIDEVLYHFLCYCSSVSVPAKKEYLQVFVETELKQVVRKKDIHIDSLTANYSYDEITAFEQAVSVISYTTLQTYDTYVMESIVEDYSSFKIKLREFMTLRLSERVQNIFNEQYSRMTTGTDVLDIADDTEIALTLARSIYNVEAIEDLDFNVGDSTKKNDKAVLISRTGIAAIDEDYGGTFSGALLTFAGQPGVGKTRFLCAAFIYPALVKYCIGVRMDELELDDYEVNNILVSIHIAKMFNVKIPDRDINRDELSDEQRKIVNAARIDLFESNKYGRFALSCNPLYYEEIDKKLTTYLKFNKDIKIWCVDYTGYIGSKPINRWEVKTKAAIINDSLELAKKIAKRTRVCAIFVNQYNDEGNKTALQGGAITVGMIQGGQAVQRHSDYDIALTQTAEQKAGNIIMMSTTKNRASVGFTNVPLHVDKAISRFTQHSGIEIRS